MTEHKIVMLRHGESEWTGRNLFCGWYDSKLSERGKREALTAGEALKCENCKFDIAFTSALTRTHQTLDAIMKAIDQDDIQIVKTWRLNERHYGSLTGLSKAETAAKYGEKQVEIWRRSYDILPPPMEPDHPYYGEIVNDPRYVGELTLEEIPKVESLKLTIERTLPFWNEFIVPQIQFGKSILIVAHGTSLRGIIKHLDDVSPEEIMQLNLPTGIPFVYILDDNLKPVPGGSLQFLAEPEIVKKLMAEVAAQGKAK